VPRLYVECVSGDAGSWLGRTQARAPTVHESIKRRIGTRRAQAKCLRSTREAGSQARVPVPQCKRDAGSVNSKEARVNKRDSPRISADIHIDRKQPLGVSLKGSSLRGLATLRSG